MSNFMQWTRRRREGSYVKQHLVFLGRRLSLLLGGAGIFTVVGIVQLIEGAHHRSAWFWLFLGALLLAIAEMSAVHKSMRAGPHLAFVGTDSADAVTVSTSIAASTGVWSLAPVLSPAASASVSPSPSGVAVNRFVRVLVANDPGDRVGECARQVAARITFLDDSDQPLLPEMIGRWAETPQRAQTGHIGLTLQESQLDIEANGLPHALDVAMKAPGEGHLYAFNHENSQAIDLRLDRHLLGVAECRVRVTVRPANGRPISGTFVLQSDRGGL